MGVMGRTQKVSDILTVYLDIFHSIAQTLVYRVNQGGRRVNWNPVIYPVSRVPIAPIDHLPSDIGTAIPH